MGSRFTMRSAPRVVNAPPTAQLQYSQMFTRLSARRTITEPSGALNPRGHSDLRSKLYLTHCSFSIY